MHLMMDALRVCYVHIVHPREHRCRQVWMHAAVRRLHAYYSASNLPAKSSRVFECRDIQCQPRGTFDAMQSDICP
jgi:hypothetical protein